MRKNNIALRNIIGAVIGFGIVAIAQSKMGWTDGSWDLLRFGGAVLMGALPGWVLADTYLKFIKWKKKKVSQISLILLKKFNPT